jgi:hypothetical protein
VCGANGLIARRAGWQKNCRDLSIGRASAIRRLQGVPSSTIFA